MNDSYFNQRKWICPACNSINYCWSSWCFYCFAENKMFKKGKPGVVVDVEDSMKPKATESRERDFFYDMTFKETIDECRYLLYGFRFKEFIQRYRSMTDILKVEEGDNGCKVIFLYEQLALIQEQVFEIKKAAESIEIAKTQWDKYYGPADDDHYQFLLSRLSICYSSLYSLPDHGPIYRTHKAKNCLNKLLGISQRQYGLNSVHVLSIYLDLCKMSFERSRRYLGIVYLIDALEIHENIFIKALNRVSNKVNYVRN